jgi:DNA-binding response OmpR family regulator
MPKVLIVDDDPSVLNFVRRSLELEGFVVVDAADASAAWRALTDDEPDAAVMDLRLQGTMDGWALIRRIRDEGRLSRIPIVAMTGQSDEQTRVKAEELGCAFLAKPFDEKGLLGELRTAFRRALRPTRIALLLTGARVEGIVHLPVGQTRFSDAWESVMRDGRSSVPVTEATVRPYGGGEPIKATLIQIQKDQVLAVLPDEGAEETEPRAGRRR